MDFNLPLYYILTAFDIDGRTRWGVSGALNLKSALAGSNTRLEASEPYSPGFEGDVDRSGPVSQTL